MYVRDSLPIPAGKTYPSAQGIFREQTPWGHWPIHRTVRCMSLSCVRLGVPKPRSGILPVLFAISLSFLSWGDGVHGFGDRTQASRHHLPA